jgi:hypothetical protein|tara:strand:+ start:727 stop:1026 length:300 start_codon:yes stop_codon:yes gene_type:complete
MAKTTKKTKIHIALAKDIFIVGKQFEKINETVISFTLEEDDFKLKNRGDYNRGILFGWDSSIVSLETEKIEKGKQIKRTYKRVGSEYKLINENISYSED